MSIRTDARKSKPAALCGGVTSARMLGKEHYTDGDSIAPARAKMAAQTNKSVEVHPCGIGPTIRR
eukprot:scaffold88281_cov32-Tisochrysis_lutea.AAC.3